MGHNICKPQEVCTAMDGSASLKPCHSGVSTDVLLFSEINESLVHHYRVHKRGLPHLAFRKDDLTCLRVFESQAAALSQGDMVSPVQPTPVSMRHACFSGQESVSPRTTRSARRRIRPIRVLEESVGVEPLTLTVQDVLDLTGAIVPDCRPPLLPVSLWLKGYWPVASAPTSCFSQPGCTSSGGASPERVAIPVLVELIWRTNYPHLRSPC